MNKVAELQSNLARTVHRRMQQIDSLVNGNIPRQQQRNVVDPEVEYWKQKIAALSVPVTDGQKTRAPQIRSSRYVLPKALQRHPELPDYRKREAIVAPMERLRVHRRVRKLEERSRRGFSGPPLRSRPYDEPDVVIRSSSRSSSERRSQIRTDYRGVPETNTCVRSSSSKSAEKSLCTGCFEFVSDCRCGGGRSSKSLLCSTCFDVPCVCSK